MTPQDTHPARTAGRSPCKRPSPPWLSMFLGVGRQNPSAPDHQGPISHPSGVPQVTAGPHGGRSGPDSAGGPISDEPLTRCGGRGTQQTWERPRPHPLVCLSTLPPKGARWAWPSRRGALTCPCAVLPAVRDHCVTCQPPQGGPPVPRRQLLSLPCHLVGLGQPGVSPG